MIATRSQVRSTSSMMCELRNTVRPSVRASRTISKNVCWTSGSRPDVGSSRISRSGPVLERDDQADLLLVALRVLLEPAARVEVEALDELGHVAGIDATAQVGEVLDGVAAGEPVVEVELAGQVADPAVDGDRVGGRLDAEDLARPDVGRMRSSRMRIVVVLPAPFGPRKPKISPSSTSRSSSVMPRWAP